MALLGSTVDPRLFVQDYSGFTRAADIQAQSMANLGGQIAGGIERYGEQKQERKKLDAGIKATVTGIESAIKMGESLGIRDIKSSLTPYLDKINDPNVSPIEAAAYAKEASNTISNALGLGMKANELAVGKEQYDQAAAARIAELKDSKWQSYDKEIEIYGQKVKVTGAVDQFGQFKDIKNNVYPSVMDAFAPEGRAEPALPNGAFPDGRPTVGTPMDGPGVLQPKGVIGVPTPSSNIDYNQFPSVPGDAAVAPEVMANIEAAGEAPVVAPRKIQLPPGSSIVAKEPKGQFRPATPQEAQERGAIAGQINTKTNQFFPINPPSGMTIEQTPDGGFKFVQGVGVGGKTANEPTVKLGEGQQLVPDPTSPTGTRVANIPGGKAEQQAQQEEAAKELTKARSLDQASVALDEIDRFIEYTGKMSKLPFASPARRLMATAGMEQQSEAESSLDTVKANLKFEALDALRKASPSGASGLGQVTQNEFSALADQWGTLRLVGDPEKIQERALSIKRKLLDTVHGNQAHRDAMLKKGVITPQQYNDIQSQYPNGKQVTSEDARIDRFRKVFSTQPTQ